MLSLLDLWNKDNKVCSMLSKFLAEAWKANRNPDTPKTVLQLMTTLQSFVQNHRFCTLGIIGIFITVYHLNNFALFLPTYHSYTLFLFLEVIHENILTY